MNAAPGIGSADVYVVPAGSALSGAPTVAGLAYGQSSGYQGLALTTTSGATAQDFTVFFTEPGTTLVLVDSNQLAFTSGQNRTLVALNRQGEGGFTFTVLPDLN